MHHGRLGAASARQTAHRSDNLLAVKTHTQLSTLHAQTLLRSLRQGRWLGAALGLFIAVAVIAISNPAKIWSSTQQIDVVSVVVAVIVNIPIVVLRAFRTQLILRRLNYQLSLRTMMPIQLVGQTSSSLTPAASGDFVRAYLWRSRFNVPLRVGAAVITFERLYSLFLLIVVSVLLISLPRHGLIGWTAVAIGFSLAIFAPIILELFPPAFERRALARLTRSRELSRFADGALGMMDQLRLLMRAPVLLGWTSFTTLTIFVLSGFQIWLILDGLGHRVPITQAVAAFATSQVTGIISTLPFGIGSADAILVTVFAGYGVSVTLAATVAILIRTVATLPQALAGLFAYLAIADPSPTVGLEAE